MSKLIKRAHYYTLDDIKLIEVTERLKISRASEEQNSLSNEQQQELQEAFQMKDQILRDAEAYAEDQLRQTMEQVAIAQEQARHDIEAWWSARREEDAQAVSEARQQGYEQGYQEGAASAASTVEADYAGMLQEARTVLEQAYEIKQHIILEAEPFLVELSCSIAEKIIQKQLTVSPGWVIELASSVLARRRERGLITICVAPQHFGLFQDAREELMLAIDSQAELQILPDASVSDYGCVVRSAFGSIDARIDTQLKEIKKALQQLAYSDEEANRHD